MTRNGGAAPESIGVLGAGSWGSALSILLARNGLRVRLWGRNPEALARLRQERENSRYLPGISFPEGLELASDLAELVGNERRLLIVVPSHAFRSLLEQIKPRLSEQSIVAWATKGLEPGSGRPLHEVVEEVLGAGVAGGIISGPTFAREVARGLPTACVVAAREERVATCIADWFRNERLRVYTSVDLPGVQLGGAIKNVIAIAAGISDGLGFGASARAALITRGLAELARLGVAMGGMRGTFMGLAGAGDLVLTCTDDLSRNRRVGLGLGRGETLPRVLAALGQEAEGVATAKELHRLAARLGVEMPISEQVYRVLYERRSPQAAVEALLRREPRREHEVLD